MNGALTGNSRWRHSLRRMGEPSAIKASVVVPVYNPGAHMDDLVRSVLGQSLPPSEYEAVFVDDGSTDGTAERLDALAARHEVIRVAHIPNSGWPGRPRNVARW